MPNDNTFLTHHRLLCLIQGVGEVLVKLGAKGSALFEEGQKPIRQPIIPAARVIDTTGAGDTFTAAFAVASVEGKTKDECLRFAGMAVVLSLHVIVILIFFSNCHMQKIKGGSLKILYSYSCIST